MRARRGPRRRRPRWPGRRPRPGRAAASAPASRRCAPRSWRSSLAAISAAAASWSSPSSSACHPSGRCEEQPAGPTDDLLVGRRRRPGSRNVVVVVEHPAGDLEGGVGQPGEVEVAPQRGRRRRRRAWPARPRGRPRRRPRAPGAAARWRWRPSGPRPPRRSPTSSATARPTSPVPHQRQVTSSTCSSSTSSSSTVQLAADRVVVEGPGAPGGDHVEAGEVAAGGAAVAGGGIGADGTGAAAEPSHRRVERPFAYVHYVRTCVRSTLAGGQRTFDDLGTPAVARSPSACSTSRPPAATPAPTRITEIGAVKVRGGEPLGTFQTFVNPGTRIPPHRSPCSPASPSRWSCRRRRSTPSCPRSSSSSAAPCSSATTSASTSPSSTPPSCAPAGPASAPRTVDTCALARRLVRDEVPNCRLRHPRRPLPAPPPPDATAPSTTPSPPPTCCTLLLERAAAYGVTGLDDLLALPTHRRPPAGGQAQAHRRAAPPPGVYLFRDRGGRALYVGKATDLRSRVRSLLLLRRPPQDRPDAPRGARHRPPPVRLAARGRACSRPGCSTPSAPATTARAPGGTTAAYVRLDPTEACPRLVVARSPPRAAASCSARCRRPRSPASSSRPSRTWRRCGAARPASAPALVRRCATRRAPPAQLGVALCPCAGDGRRGRATAPSSTASCRGLTVEPRLLLDPLAERIAALARRRALRGGRRRPRPGRGAGRRPAPHAGGSTPSARAGRVELALPGGIGADARARRSCGRATAPGALPGVGRPDRARPRAPNRRRRRRPATPLPAEAADELAGRRRRSSTATPAASASPTVERRLVQPAAPPPDLPARWEPAGRANRLSSVPITLRASAATAVAALAVAWCSPTEPADALAAWPTRTARPSPSRRAPRRWRRGHPVLAQYDFAVIGTVTGIRTDEREGSPTYGATEIDVRSTASSAPSRRPPARRCAPPIRAGWPATASSSASPTSSRSGALPRRLVNCTGCDPSRARRPRGRRRRVGALADGPASRSTAGEQRPRRRLSRTSWFVPVTSAVPSPRPLPPSWRCAGVRCGPSPSRRC